MNDSVARIQRAVAEGLPEDRRSLLAVSGGIDSMVLLHAATAVRHPADLVVATFDHGTGEQAKRAVGLVERVAMSAGVSVVVGRGEPMERPTEAGWRHSRIAFLTAAALEHRAAICTAHTADDQVETVLFRELRGAGPRGLAGLAAAGTTRRPLLDVTRAQVADYAGAAGVEWVDDPTNLDLSFARNRLRHELLPALRRVCPAIDAELIAIGKRAADWRADVEAAVDERIDSSADPEAGVLDVPAGALGGFSADALAVIWPVLLSRIGIAADRRGTRRLVAFTTGGSTGQRIQLSGGWTVYRRRGRFEIRREGRPGSAREPGH
jgi:tRNA(Ile)-lysidine synthase